MSKRSRRRNRQYNNQMKKENTEMMTSMETLDASILERDFSYQRPVNMNRVREIVDQFDADLVNILKVSFRDGHYYVFDGSHTLEALRMVNGKEHFPVVCKLYKGLTYEREAKLFAMQTGNSARVGMPYKLRALEQAGDVPTVHFLEVTRSCGFEIAPGERNNKKDTIAAVCKAHSVYQTLGEEMYMGMLNLIKDTWDGEPWFVSQNMLGGMALFYKTYAGKINRDRFLNKLSAASRIEIQREASKHVNMPVGYQFAFAIASIYNHGGAKGTLKLNRLTINLIEEEDE